MTSHTTYLITGANRGIGLGMTANLLARPDTTVIATVRSKETDTAELHALPVATGSVLVVLPLSYAILSDSSERSTFMNALRTNGITQINTLIANAGTSSFDPILKTSLDTMISTHETNTLFPLLLFQTLHPLLSIVQSPKFILISSVLGSLAVGASEGDTLAYGSSKASANYFVRRLHFEFPDIVALAVHPGWVQTENGFKFAESVGYEAGPPSGVEGSVTGVLEQIDKATKETTSGSFLAYDGSVVPW